MKKTEIEKFRNELLERREGLIEDLRRMEEATLRTRVSGAARDRGGAPTHPAELASASTELDLGLEALEQKEAALHSIDQALARMHSGKFGVCEECGGSIPLVRLRALPQARHCLSCQQRMEQGSVY